MPAYIVEGSNLTEWNTTTYAFINSVPLGSSSVASICLSPDGNTVYTGDTNSGLISSFNANTLAPIATTTVTADASHITVYASTDGLRLFVADRGLNVVYVLNAATLASITSFIVPSPYGIVQLPGDGNLFICEEISGNVGVFDPTAFTTITTIAVGADPTNIVCTSDGATVYCVNFTSPSVTAINAGTYATTTIALSGASLAINLAITANNDFLYVTSGFFAVAWEIQIPANTVTNLTIGAAGQGIATTPDSAQYWIVENTQFEAYGSPSNSLLDTTTGLSNAEVLVITPASVAATGMLVMIV
jgi:DNA-binding beta-propeller fold protein YncE